MRLYHLQKTQRIALSLDKAWDFFSNPLNLPKITPPELGFEIISNLPETMYPGMIIEYRVRPFLNIPAQWVTEITQVKHQNFFIDEQRFGPYKFWHHQHLFQEVDNGVEISDLIHYAMPFGIAGRFAHWLFVKRQLEYIFSYRSKIIEELI